MTYKELLLSLTFDKIAPHLKRYLEPNESLMWYEIHFDMLRQMAPTKQLLTEEGDPETIIVSYYEPDEGENVAKDLLDAFPLEGGIWEESLAKPLEIADNVTAPLEEVAACCLWHSSFHGFTEHDLDLLFRSWTGDYPRDEYEHFKAKYGKWIPSAKTMMKTNRELHHRVRHEMHKLRGRNDYKEYQQYGFCPCKWRSRKRWEINDQYYKLVSRIGGFVERLTEHGSSMVEPANAQELCSILFYCSSIHIDMLPTFSGDASKRIGYIRHLITTYDVFKNFSGCKGIFCVYMSSEHPLTMEELSCLNDLLFGKVEGLIWGVKIDDSLGQEIRMDYALYKQ